METQAKRQTYDLVIEILSDIVQNYLVSQKTSRATVDNEVKSIILEMMQKETEERLHQELTAEILGTTEFKRVA